MGLRDVHDDLVQVTLHALGDLVPHIGAELVMGTSRRCIFANSQPRVRRGRGMVVVCVCASVRAVCE